MKKMLILSFFMAINLCVYAQNTLKAVVKNNETKEVLVGVTASIKGTSNGAISDEKGQITLSNIPDGLQEIHFSYLGFEEFTEIIKFPLKENGIIEILLKENSEELESVVITSTRSTRSIQNIPTRIEFIGGEELEEKGNMKPGDIRMLLAESTGIQTQQTSATSGNSAIRIQGLDGKYTQVIRDGFPLYSGFSGGLGLLQVAPLDLQQVEVIKGSSSTLYGGGAIAGLVNLVSKKPTEQRQLNFLLNGTSALGLDASGFYAQKFNGIGTTIYAAYNHGTAYDPADIGLTAIPKFDRFTLNPKVFFYFNENTTLMAGINATSEKRIGGDMEYIKGNGSTDHSYFEENKTGRYSTQLELDRRINDRAKFVIKNSVSYYDRTIGLPAYQFSGDQLSTYTEANYSLNGEKTDWVLGANFLTDKFTEKQVAGTPVRDYNYTTVGGFVQNTWNTSDKITIESGIRGDYHNRFGFFFLPRISTLWKINEHFSTRLGGGLGYKAPTVFTEDAERIQFRGVLPLNLDDTKAERSYGANYDINYKTALFDGQVRFSINHMFFYTRINNPVLLTSTTGNMYQYVQPSGNFDTKGMETNVKLTYGDFKLFVGYTYANVNQHTDGTSKIYPLVSKHRLNNVLMYEIEEKWKVGAEAYYFSPQQLNDGSTGKGYWTAGLMAERIWERFSIFANFENYTNTRQTKFGPIYSGPITNPVFQDIYAPVDGFVINVGIKLKF
ncbi:TonB-dependent receptor [Chryseobacterium indologenes]|uniref:TonB-dependent receptor n=4 Tax=Bacteroidota TaxID=976 RepID=A0A3G6RJG3_CHRLC|nr:TonB-dependent receptor [Chryseobacterium angstadtii]AZA84577.1 TonB-dependent receptor [Chryseobacterium lactis]MBF6643615.1 TonB-dependent receptor [Chryseobacterium indologenes]SHG56696.1 iron complex outermembrane recepter protein [Chryseobacterium oranimense]AZB04965.1 TonB-dependent receptor [Chryseobacterium lactis]KMQ64440.1 collagen-binding protein [Chryseobacterium angstadtii]